jgi:hypothetical protein
MTPEQIEASCTGECYRRLSGDERLALQFIIDDFSFEGGDEEYYEQVIQAMLDDDARGKVDE